MKVAFQCCMQRKKLRAAQRCLPVARSQELLESPQQQLLCPGITFMQRVTLAQMAMAEVRCALYGIHGEASPDDAGIDLQQVAIEVVSEKKIQADDVGGSAFAYASPGGKLRKEGGVVVVEQCMVKLAVSVLQIAILPPRHL